HQSSQVLREELKDKDNTILLLRDCEEELLRGLNFLEIQNLNQRATNLQEWLYYKDVLEGRIIFDVNLLDWAGNCV
ncbi:4449_t:CDS:2, partial [Funneliformis geosporum]